jgi:hypothetical protein
MATTITFPSAIRVRRARWLGQMSSSAGWLATMVAQWHGIPSGASFPATARRGEARTRFTVSRRRQCVREKEERGGGAGHQRVRELQRARPWWTVKKIGQFGPYPRPTRLQAGCNTPGVCYPLSSGFELKHGRLSGDEDVKVKPMETSPNLNLDVAPLLYI